MWSFDGSDGAYPVGGLVDVDGRLYGTTSDGGDGGGTAFVVMPGTWYLETIHIFNGSDGGSNPTATLIVGSDGYLYGTTSTNIFKMDLDGNVTSVLDFNGVYGVSPYANLLQATDGWLYGVAGRGPFGAGLVFRLSNAQIAVNEVSPSSGGGEAGAPLTVLGGGFAPGVTVTIGGVAATDVTVADPTFLYLLLPALSPGTYDVTVTAPGGESATHPAAYTVTPLGPTITSFTPTAGPINTRVTINGTGFTGVSSVKFNGKPASFNLLSPTQLTANVPAGTTTGKITVTTPGGTATSATDFIVVLPPTVTG
jgi:hypothetical protein